MASIPWFEVMFGALERLFVLCIQLGLSLMVMQVFTRGRVIWLVLAIVWHALIDASAVVALSLSGVYAAEAITALAALVSLLFVASLKRPEPVAEEPEPLPRTGPARTIKIEPTKEKLEESRYV